MTIRVLVVAMLLFVAACQTNEQDSSSFSENWNRTDDPLIAGNTTELPDSLVLSEVFVDSVFTMRGRLVHLRAGTVDDVSASGEVESEPNSEGEGMTPSRTLGVSYGIGESGIQTILISVDELEAAANSGSNVFRLEEAQIQDVFANDLSLEASICPDSPAGCRQFDLLINVISRQYKVYPQGS